MKNIILSADKKLTENIKWNSPNYCYDEDDRITMRVQPFKKIQLIFHRGAKKLEQPKQKLIVDKIGFLLWKENDRAIATFETMAAIEKHQNHLNQIIKNWIAATR